MVKQQQSQSETSQTRVHAPHADPIDFNDRLLAEAVRAAEELRGDPFDDDLADESGRAIDGDFERRIIERARALPESGQLQTALRHVDQALTWLILAAAILIVLTGAAAARAALGAGHDRPVLFLPALGGLLGVQSLLLLAWLALWLVRPRSLPTGSLGGIVLRAAGYMARIGSHSREHLAALQAQLSVSLQPAIVRWKAGAISNGLWSAFNIGCIAMLLILLSTRYYTFAWETTILPTKAFAPVIEAIAWLPGKVGFQTPTAVQIAESQWSGGELPDASRQAWAGLLVGAMVVYGLVPRMLLTMFCIIGLRHAQKKYKLDTTLHGYIRLQHRLTPRAVSIGVIDADDAPVVGAAAFDTPSQRGADNRSVGSAVAIVGVEIDQPQTGWPPRIPDIELFDVGRFDDRIGRERALEKLRDCPQIPRLTAIVCAITTTPDRGIAATINQLRTVAGSPITLLLTGGQALRRRGAPHKIDDRIRDWRDMAQGLNLDDEHVIEIDFDHATDASLKSLATRLGTSDSVREKDAAAHAPAQRRIEQAFDTISIHAAQWTDSPGTEQQVALHTEIAKLYRAQRQSLFESIKFDTSSAAKLAARMKDGATRTLTLLPARLHNTPKWAAAGAAAGAIGCLAIATLATPAALAVIPTWAALGGVVTGALHAARKLSSPKTTEKTDENEPLDQIGVADAIRAAAMFAVLLDLQGRDETTISRVLDKTFVIENDPAARGEALINWLDDLRRHYDMALASETGAAS